MRDAARAADIGGKCYSAPGGNGNETLTPDPPDFAALADRVRALAMQSDPDVLRAGLAAVAAELDGDGREARP
jgi:hypothetical protein